MIDPERGRTWTEALVAKLRGAAPAFATALARARELPAQAIVDAQEELLTDPAFRGTRGGAMPIVDPASLPVDPASAPAMRPEVPVLIGTNADEGTFFFRAGGRRADPDDGRLAEMVAHLAHASDPEALIAHARAQAGGAADNNDVLCAIVTEAWFAGPVRALERGPGGRGRDRVPVPDRPAVGRGRPRRHPFAERAAAVRQLA